MKYDSVSCYARESSDDRLNCIKHKKKEFVGKLLIYCTKNCDCLRKAWAVQRNILHQVHGSYSAN